MAESISKHYNANARHWSVLVAYAAGEVSEGMACNILSIDRVTLRTIAADANKVAGELSDRYRRERLTVADDMAAETVAFDGRVFFD